jgi:hypothetical protein
MFYSSNVGMPVRASREAWRMLVYTHQKRHEIRHQFMEEPLGEYLWKNRLTSVYGKTGR